MTDTEPDDMAAVEVARLCSAIEAGRLTCAEAMYRAIALGAELERLAAMRRACDEYDHARAARVAAFAAERRSRRTTRARRRRSRAHPPYAANHDSQLRRVRVAHAAR